MNFLAVLAVLLPLVAGLDQQQLSIEVFYEPLCPDSIAFVNKQLYPLYTSVLKPRVNITLVPFGRSNITTGPNGFEMSCRHGPVECYGNRVQACAVKNLNTDQSKLMSFVNCLMENASKTTEYPVSTCSEKTGLTTTDEIVKCANSTEGELLVADNANRTNTLEPPLGSVPTIILKNVFSEDNQKKAVANLKGLVCEKLEGDKPRECTNGASSAGKLTLSVLLFFVGFRLF